MSRFGNSARDQQDLVFEKFAAAAAAKGASAVDPARLKELSHKLFDSVDALSKAERRLLISILVKTIQEKTAELAATDEASIRRALFIYVNSALALLGYANEVTREASSDRDKLKDRDLSPIKRTIDAHDLLIQEVAALGMTQAERDFSDVITKRIEARVERGEDPKSAYDAEMKWGVEHEAEYIPDHVHADATPPEGELHTGLYL